MKRTGVLLAICMQLVGCQNNGEDEPPMREPDYVKMEDGVTVFEAPADGCDLTINFSTNTVWNVEYGRYAEGYVAAPLQESGGAGNHKMTVTVTPNVGVDALPRSFQFSIKAGLASAEITITQQPNIIQLPDEAEVRTYLIQLYNDAGLANCKWAAKWGSDLPINEWGPEVNYEKGRLNLYLSDRKLKGKINLSGCKALESLRCSKNQISEINVSNCPLLNYIDATNVGLKSINLEGCLSINRLSVPYNPLTDIDIAWSSTISELQVHDCNLTTIDLERCEWLSTVGVNNNRLRDINIPRRGHLRLFFCYSNELSTLDLSNTPLLQLLNCGENNLTELNVKGCPRLHALYCYDNRLSSVDVDDQKNVLSQYYCYSNLFGTLNLDGFRELSELHCSDNGLTSLNIAGCKKIRWLYCSYNKLDELDISAPDRDTFERLDCSYNRMRKIDITSMRPLRLWCQGNLIGGEIPEHFDRLLEFEYDVRYEYYPENSTYTDRGYGWYYPGEPEKMQHCR